VHETVVPGTHVSMCEEPNVQTLAERMRFLLAELEADVAAAQ
jgi:thioesterase domain-containing protein